MKQFIYRCEVPQELHELSNEKKEKLKKDNLWPQFKEDYYNKLGSEFDDILKNVPKEIATGFSSYMKWWLRLKLVCSNWQPRNYFSCYSESFLRQNKLYSLYSLKHQFFLSFLKLSIKWVVASVLLITSISILLLSYSSSQTLNVHIWSKKGGDSVLHIKTISSHLLRVKHLRVRTRRCATLFINYLTQLQI